MPGSLSATLRSWLPPVLAVALLAGLTEWPYAHGRRAAGPGRHFDGMIAYSVDIHAYLSFVRQSAEGRVLFENRYAAAPHRPVFFNLEWLLVGRVARGRGDPAVLTFWRLLGVVVLVCGVWGLSHLLTTWSERVWALAVFTFGGGLGFIQAFAAPAGPLPLDLGTYGLHPFVQMLQNPHFAVPHGLVLAALAFLATGEKTGRTAPYACAGFLALLAGLARPYELLAFAVALPALHLLSPERRYVRRLGQRALALLMTLPAWIPVLVIWRDPAYRPLTSQGQMSRIDFGAMVVGIGLCLLLVAFRLVRDPRGLLSRPENRLLAIWGAAILCLVQANHWFDTLNYSPQLMITTMGPLVLLAAPVVAEAGRIGPRRWLFVATFALTLPSSGLVLAQRIEDAATPYFRFSDAERNAWEWLAARARPTDLVLSGAESGNRLPRRVSAHVFVGHWTLTPDYAARKAEAESFFRGLDPQAASALVRRWGVDWIWVGPAERSLGGGPPPEALSQCAEAYRLQGVRILRCGDAPARP
jgi:hypothetical protein